MGQLEYQIKKAESESIKNKLIQDMSKKRFIKDIKNGLGDNIKKNPNTIKKVKKGFLITKYY